jgi:hypothetical protein
MSLRRFSEICRPPRKLSVNSAVNAFVLFYASCKKSAKIPDSVSNARLFIPPAIKIALACVACVGRNAWLAGLSAIAIVSQQA